MKKEHLTRSFLFLLCLAFCLAGCDVHEWPDTPETVTFRLRLVYDTDMTEWNHTYDGENVVEVGYGETYDNSRESGTIRYVIRAYPVTNGQTSSQYSDEFTFTQDISKGYDYETTLDLASGNYSLMVWSDLVESSGNSPFYDESSFSEVTLQGEHAGNDDYRDAFQGTGSISLSAGVDEYEPSTYVIPMERPLAKYEFITTDLAEFIEKEATRIAVKESGESSTKVDIDIDDYRIIFYYIGFMPDAFSIFTDKPVDSSTGVLFESELSRLSAAEASLGFDYVFVNGTESSVTVQIGIYDSAGTQLSMSSSIRVPLKRSYHTIIRGDLLTAEASGGISIDPAYDGDYNIFY